MKLSDIKIGGRRRKDLGDIEALAASMSKVGLLHPVVVRPDGTLVAGERRLTAARQLGWTDISVTVVTNLDDALQALYAERDENECRKSLTPSEMVALARVLKPLEDQAAKDREAAGRKRGTALPRTEKFSERDKGRALDKVASAVGTTRPTLAKAEAVVAAAEAEPDKYAPLVEEMDKTGKVNGAHKKLVTRRQAEQIQREPPVLPGDKYRVLVADPPWSYDHRAQDATHRAANPYPSMAIDEIKALPVGDLAYGDCILWLWTTNAHMPQAFDVAEAWGFECKTILTWVKDRMGMGDWLRGQTEHCLMCVRGKPVITLTNQTTVLHAPLREHSRKPDEFYTLVEALCPGSKVELFARQTRAGWSVYGNDTHQF